MSVQEYVLKTPAPLKSKAIQVGLANGLEIRAFVGSDNIETVPTFNSNYRALRVYAQLSTYMNWVPVTQGYWVVKEPNGDIKVLSNSEFDKTYKPAVETVTFQFYKEPAAGQPKKKPNDGLQKIRALQSALRSLRGSLRNFRDEKEGDLYTLQDRSARETEQDGKAQAHTVTAVKQVNADFETLTQLMSDASRIYERASGLVPALRD